MFLSLSQINSPGGLSLSQIQGGTNLLILNNSSSAAVNSNHPPASVGNGSNFKYNKTSAVLTSNQQPPLKQYHHPRNKVILKHESANSNQLSCCRLINNQVTRKLDDSDKDHCNVSHFENNVFSNQKIDDEKNLVSHSVACSKFMNSTENPGELVNHLSFFLPY